MINPKNRSKTHGFKTFKFSALPTINHQLMTADSPTIFWVIQRHSCGDKLFTINNKLSLHQSMETFKRDFPLWQGYPPKPLYSYTIRI